MKCLRALFATTTLLTGIGAGNATVRIVDDPGGRIGTLCLSEIKSGHIRDAVHRGLGGKEYALPSLRSAIEAHPCPRPSACASHYSSEREISESGADVPGQ